MQQKDLFLRRILPILKTFPSLKLSILDKKKIEETVRSLLNTKSIYNALDLPDVRLLKERHTQLEAMKLLIKEKDLFTNYSIENNIEGFSIIIDSIKYTPVIFFFNEIPKINFQIENAAIFLFTEDLEKVFFCGLYDEKILNSVTIVENNMRYLVNFDRI